MRKMLIIMMIFVLWISLFQWFNLASAAEPAYPTKPITYYIPFATGGTITIVSNPLLEAAEKYLGQPFIVIHKPGGGATVGAITVMNSKPDGYSIGIFNGSNVLLSPHFEESPYRDLNGFTFIINFGKFVWPIIARSEAPYKTWKEFVEWARKNPSGATKMGTPSARGRGPATLALAQVEEKEKLTFTFIVQKGSSESITNLLGGHINLEAMSITPTHMQYLETGKLRILAYITETKMSGYENLPSFEKMYGILAASYLGVYGPKGLPKHAVAKLEDAFSKAAKDPKFIEAMKANAMGVNYMNSADTEKNIREDFKKYGDLLKALKDSDQIEKR
jgi:tripartite-type tricarboxylate transporter receptor subunit TctC